MVYLRKKIKNTIMNQFKINLKKLEPIELFPHIVFIESEANMPMAT